MGINEEEIERSIDAMINIPTPPATSDFPVTGLDLAGDQPIFKVPDTGSPPVFQPNHLDLGWIPSVGFKGYMTQPTPDPLGSVKTNNPKDMTDPIADAYDRWNQIIDQTEPYHLPDDKAKEIDKILASASNSLESKA